MDNNAIIRHSQRGRIYRSFPHVLSLLSAITDSEMNCLPEIDPYPLINGCWDKIRNKFQHEYQEAIEYELFTTYVLSCSNASHNERIRLYRDLTLVRELTQILLSGSPVSMNPPPPVSNTPTLDIESYINNCWRQIQHIFIKQPEGVEEQLFRMYLTAVVDRVYIRSSLEGSEQVRASTAGDGHMAAFPASANCATPDIMTDPSANRAHALTTALQANNHSTSTPKSPIGKHSIANLSRHTSPFTTAKRSLFPLSEPLLDSNFSPQPSYTSPQTDKAPAPSPQHQRRIRYTLVNRMTITDGIPVRTTQSHIDYVSILKDCKEMFNMRYVCNTDPGNKLIPFQDRRESTRVYKCSCQNNILSTNVEAVLIRLAPQIDPDGQIKAIQIAFADHSREACLTHFRDKLQLSSIIKGSQIPQFVSDCINKIFLSSGGTYTASDVVLFLFTGREPTSPEAAQWTRNLLIGNDSSTTEEFLEHISQVSVFNAYTNALPNPVHDKIDTLLLFGCNYKTIQGVMTYVNLHDYASFATTRDRLLKAVKFPAQSHSYSEDYSTLERTEVEVLGVMESESTDQPTPFEMPNPRRSPLHTSSPDATLPAFSGIGHFIQHWGFSSPEQILTVPVAPFLGRLREHYSLDEKFRQLCSCILWTTPAQIYTLSILCTDPDFPMVFTIDGKFKLYRAGDGIGPVLIHFGAMILNICNGNPVRSFLPLFNAICPSESAPATSLLCIGVRHLLMVFCDLEFQPKFIVSDMSAGIQSGAATVFPMPGCKHLSDIEHVRALLKNPGGKWRPMVTDDHYYIVSRHVEKIADNRGTTHHHNLAGMALAGWERSGEHKFATFFRKNKYHTHAGLPIGCQDIPYIGYESLTVGQERYFGTLKGRPRVGKVGILLPDIGMRKFLVEQIPSLAKCDRRILEKFNHGAITINIDTFLPPDHIIGLSCLYGAVDVKKLDSHHLGGGVYGSYLCNGPARLGKDITESDVTEYFRCLTQRLSRNQMHSLAQALGSFEAYAGKTLNFCHVMSRTQLDALLREETPMYCGPVFTHVGEMYSGTYVCVCQIAKREIFCPAAFYLNSTLNGADMSGHCVVLETLISPAYSGQSAELYRKARRRRPNVGQQPAGTRILSLLGVEWPETKSGVVDKIIFLSLLPVATFRVMLKITRKCRKGESKILKSLRLRVGTLMLQTSLQRELEHEACNQVMTDSYIATRAEAGIYLRLTEVEALNRNITTTADFIGGATGVGAFFFDIYPPAADNEIPASCEGFILRPFGMEQIGSIWLTGMLQGIGHVCGRGQSDGGIFHQGCSDQQIFSKAHSRVFNDYPDLGPEELAEHITGNIRSYFRATNQEVKHSHHPYQVRQPRCGGSNRSIEEASTHGHDSISAVTQETEGPLSREQLLEEGISSYCALLEATPCERASFLFVCGTGSFQAVVIRELRSPNEDELSHHGRTKRAIERLERTPGTITGEECCLVDTSSMWRYYVVPKGKLRFRVGREVREGSPHLVVLGRESLCRCLFRILRHHYQDNLNRVQRFTVHLFQSNGTYLRVPAGNDLGESIDSIQRYNHSIVTSFRGESRPSPQTRIEVDATSEGTQVRLQGLNRSANSTPAHTKRAKRVRKRDPNLVSPKKRSSLTKRDQQKAERCSACLLHGVVSRDHKRKTSEKCPYHGSLASKKNCKATENLVKTPPRSAKHDQVPRDPNLRDKQKRGHSPSHYWGKQTSLQEHRDKKPRPAGAKKPPPVDTTCPDWPEERAPPDEVTLVVYDLKPVSPKEERSPSTSSSRYSALEDLVDSDPEYTEALSLFTKNRMRSQIQKATSATDAAMDKAEDRPMPGEWAMVRTYLDSPPGMLFRREQILCQGATDQKKKRPNAHNYQLWKTEWNCSQAVRHVYFLEQDENIYIPLHHPLPPECSPPKTLAEFTDSWYRCIPEEWIGPVVACMVATNHIARTQSTQGASIRALLLQEVPSLREVFSYLTDDFMDDSRFTDSRLSTLIAVSAGTPISTPNFDQISMLFSANTRDTATIACFSSAAVGNLLLNHQYPTGLHDPTKLSAALEQKIMEELGVAPNPNTDWTTLRDTFIFPYLSTSGWSLIIYSPSPGTMYLCQCYGGPEQEDTATITQTLLAAIPTNSSLIDKAIRNCCMGTEALSGYTALAHVAALFKDNCVPAGEALSLAQVVKFRRWIALCVSAGQAVFTCHWNMGDV